MAAKKIALFIFNGVQLLDVAGACDVFNEANIQSGKDLYEIDLVAFESEPVRTSAGVFLSPTRTLRHLRSPHTLLITGAPEIEKFKPDTNQLRLIEKTAREAVRYGSICTGTFVMAQTSLLKRKRVTTHWAYASRFRELYPNVELQAEKMFIKHGRLYSSAGVSAGIDLCLSLLEEDHGTDLALRVSRQLVMALRRPGGQMQFSRNEELTPSGRTTIDLLQKKFSKRLQEDLRVDILADEIQISTRHLTRLFRKELKTTPAKWVEDLRLDTVKELLEDSLHGAKEIAFECGFSSENSLRRAFLRRFGITPVQYRRSFLRA